MNRGVPKVRVPATTAGTCVVCGGTVAVFSFGKKFGLKVAKCGKCRQKGSSGRARYEERRKVEKALVRPGGK